MKMIDHYFVNLPKIYFLKKRYTFTTYLLDRVYKYCENHRTLIEIDKFQDLFPRYYLDLIE